MIIKYFLISSLTFSLSLLVYIWFNTLLFEKLTHWLLPKKIKVYLAENWTKTLPEALSEVYGGFFTQLLSCPFCVSFWLNLISVSVIVFMGFSSIYLYCLLPVTWYLTYTLYLLITKLEK